MKNPRTAGLALAVLSLLLVMACSQTKEAIRLGAITSLSGPVAGPGGWVRNGILLAQEEINAKGGVNGKQLEIVIEDDKCDPKEAVTVFEKLAKVDRVPAIVGPFCSGSVLAIGSRADESQVVSLSPGGAHPGISKAGDFVFRVTPSDVLQAEQIAKYLSNRNISSVGILFANVEWAVGMKNAISNSYHGKLASIESFEDGASDVRTQLMKIKEAHPEAVIVLTYPQNYPVVTKQINELDMLKDLTIPLIATHTFETPASLKMGTMAEKYIYTMQSFNGSSPRARDFVQRYHQRFNETPVIWALYAYDATKLLAEALGHCTEAACVRDFLYGVHYDGVSGPIAFDSNGDVLAGTYDFKHVLNGQFEVVPNPKSVTPTPA